jgi:hypothetical protein
MKIVAAIVVSVVLQTLFEGLAIADATAPMIEKINLGKTVRIFDSGLVEYVDKSANDSTKIRIGHLPTEKVAELRKAFEDANFFSLQDEYTSGTSTTKDGKQVEIIRTNFPATVLRYSSGGHTKEVAYTVAVPPLLELGNLVNDSVRFVSVRGK